MSEENDEDESLTRRRYMTYGTAVAGGSLLAGCTGSGDPESGEAAQSAAQQPTQTARTTTPEDSSYSVTMAPMGEVTFEEPPETYIAEGPMYADMAIAAGVGDGLEAMLFPTKWVPLPATYYDQFDVPWTRNGDIDHYWADGQPSKEELYAIDPDIIHSDPVKTANLSGFSEADVEEVSENVAPFFANALRVGLGRGAEWYDYESYSILDAFEKIATVYQNGDRVEPFRELHEEVKADVRERVPASEADRPTVAVLAVVGNDVSRGFAAQRLGERNLERKAYRLLGARDAFDGTGLNSVGVGSGPSAWRFGYEQLLEIDPDVIVFDGFLASFGADEFSTRFVEPMREHSVGSELTAVQNDRLYRGGAQYQGPISHLVNIEVAAKQLYPDIFGEFTTFDEMATEDQLFDRQRVADIVNGDF
jgi:iron complex transport system substrate-binding protein